MRCQNHFLNRSPSQPNVLLSEELCETVSLPGGSRLTPLLTCIHLAWDLATRKHTNSELKRSDRHLKALWWSFHDYNVTTRPCHRILDPETSEMSPSKNVCCIIVYIVPMINNKKVFPLLSPCFRLKGHI